MKLPPLKFDLYERRLKYIAYKNECGTLYVRLKMRNHLDNMPRLSGGVLKGEYVLDNVHFHWDSEHIIYGQSYPVEAHFVHYRDSMGCMETAKASKMLGAIAIVAVVYEVFTTDCPKWGPMDILTNFACCNEMEIQFCLRDLLPSYLRSYYSYGEPSCGCNAKVTWIIMAVPGILTNWQYQQLTSVCGSGSKNMSPSEEVAGKDIRFVINGYIKDPRKTKKSCPARSISACRVVSCRSVCCSVPSCCSSFC